MGVRFQGTVITHQTGTNYTVKLIDVNYSGSVTNIILAGAGFELNYLNETTERNDPIKGSNAAIYCSITNDAAGTALAAWIDTALNATKEDQYYVAIYKGEALHWYGIILTGLNTRIDAAKPYRHIINATDGLGRLKDKEFTMAKAAYLDPLYAKKTFIDLIYEVLKATPLYTTTENLLFSTAVDWYENQMPAKAAAIDPLLYARIGADTFSELLDNKTPAGISYYDVLKKICNQWNMRIMLSEGIFRLYQVNIYENGGTKFERFYNRSAGAFDGSATFTTYPITVDNDVYPHVKSANQWQWHDPLKFVYLKYPFERKNMLNELADMDLSGSPLKYSYSTNLRGNIIGGAGRRLRFSAVLQLNSSMILYPLYQLTFRLKLKIGSNYLDKDVLSAPSGMTWTTNSASVYEHLFQFIIINQKIVIEFETPDIPSGSHDNNEFSMEVKEVFFKNPLTGIDQLLIAGTDYSVAREVGSTSLTYNTSAISGNEDYFEYIGGNTESPINSYDLELEDSVIGEPIDPSSPGNLFVYNGTNWVQSTAQWRLGDAGTAFDFNLLLVREVLSGQTIPTPKYQGAFIGDNIQAHSCLIYDNYRYILANATYNVQFEIWQGEWFAVGLYRDSFYDTRPATPLPIGDFTRNGPQTIGNVNMLANEAFAAAYSIINQRAITFLTANLPTGTITSITVEPMSSLFVKKGDYLRIMSLSGGAYMQVIVAADYASLDTTISVESFENNTLFPAGSIITFDMHATAFNYLRLTDSFPTTDPAVAGVVYIDGDNFLKVSTGSG